MIDLGCKDDDIKVTPSFSFNNDEPQPLPTPKRSPRKMALEQPPSFNNWDHEKTLEPSLSFNMQGCRPTLENEAVIPLPVATAEVPLYRLLSPRPKSELDECATKLQKYYRSYRTRRNLADAAVIIEEYWWNQALSENWWHALDYASLNINSVSFYHHGKTEKAVSRWSRAKKRLAKVGKGLSKDQKARKLALQHWLEAIDPRHRYGHNLHLYYDFWFNSESTQPFFYWLDCGDGKKVDLRAKCPRSRLQTQLIKYLGPTERESYEVVVVGGRLIYKKEDVPVSTSEDSKWIFVLSTSRNLYVGQKRKGTFQHSSFLAGAATTAAGRLVAKDGFLKAIWPYSGHYLPTDENFREFIDFLVHNSVDMSGVKRCSVDDDEYPSFKKPDSIEISTSIEDSASTDISTSSTNETDSVAAGRITPRLPSTNSVSGIDTSEAGRFTPRWSTGTGARITCVRDYPPELQKKALEHVKLSPRTTPSVVQIKLPIPSPRPSPGMRPSPQLSRLGFSPRVFAADLQVRDVANGSPKFIISPIRNRIPAASPRRSPVSKLSPSAPFVGFHCPKVTLRLPSKKGRRALRKAES